MSTCSCPTRRSPGTPLVAGLLAALLVPLIGCGTIVNGSNQDIAVASTPTGATVSVDGARSWTTPATISMQRKSAHTIEISMEGYEPYQMQVTRSTSGWIWGNIIFGGLIGIAVDASTGGLYKLSPEAISEQLVRTDATARVEEGTVYLFVTLQPRTDWEWIGTLDRQEVDPD